jgi:hypothetical protein
MLVAGFLLTALGLVYAPRAQEQPTTPATTVIHPPAFGNADSNGRMIAVTGVDLTGSSILYVIDTQTRQLAVYQAQGGGASTQSVKLVGARRIDLDLQLYGYNDQSEYKYEALEKKFIDSGILDDH